MSGWIKCSERMPEVWQDVLVCGIHGNDGEKRLIDYFVGFLGTTGQWRPTNIAGEYELELYGPPTHWMPIPEPPQES